MIYVGIDFAKLNHFASAISSDGEELIKPFKFTNDNDGFQLLLSKLAPLDKDSLIIGLESTAHYGDNLVRYLVAKNYKVCVLNPIKTSTMRKNNIRNNQKLFYSLLHRCSAETLLELCENKLYFPKSCQKLRNHYVWNEFKNKLYSIDWNAEIKETFNGNGNAIEYLGRYANRIAITNARILSVNEKNVAFRAKDYKSKEQKVVAISCVEFIRRFMMHVLPNGFQNIRYYGFLNNRRKSQNLAIIFRIQGHHRFVSKLSELPMNEVLLKVWNYNIRTCPVCGCCNSMSYSDTLPRYSFILSF